RIGSLLDLLARGLRGTIIGNGRGRDENIAPAAQFAEHSGQHVSRTLDVNAANTRRGAQVHGPADEHHLGASLASRLSYRESHLSRAPVADEANRVDPFSRRTRRDQNALPLERTVAEDLVCDPVGQLD